MSRRWASVVACLFAVHASAGEPAAIDARMARIERDLRAPISIGGDARWTLRSRMQHYQVPGLTLAIIDDGRIVATRAYGLADRQTLAPMRNDTPMQAASISKALTAYAAMRMVGRGELSLSEPVNQRLQHWRIPENPFTTQTPVTLAHLLSHTGGLGVHGFVGYEPQMALPTLVQILDGQAPANSVAVRVEQLPGQAFMYSGGGYTIVQLLLSELASRPFPDLMQRDVLKPLRMRDSSYEFPLAARRMRRAAAGVTTNHRDVAGKRRVHPESAAAGLWTTAADLARFAIEVQRAVRGDSRLLGKAEAERMLRDPGPDHYALGFAIMHEGGQAYFGHDGWNEGFNAHLIANRDGDGVAIMINANEPELMNELRRAIAFEFAWPGYHEYQRTPLDAAELRDLPGRYPYNAEQFIRIRRDGEQLSFEYGGEQKFALVHVGHGRFVRPDTGLTIEIVSADDGARRLDFIATDGHMDAHLRFADNEPALRERLYAGDADVVVDYCKLADAGDILGSEAYLNNQGYRLVGQQRHAAAVQVFALTTALYPQSANAWDSLGEASLLAGDNAAARRHYEKALALNPSLTSARAALDKLVPSASH